MGITLLSISLASIGVFADIENENTSSTFSWNAFAEELQLAGVIETPFGYFAVPGFLQTAEAGSTVDTFFLTDEPGNWFKSDSLGAPLSIVNPNESVDFNLGAQTDARHTVSLLVPADELLAIDQAKAFEGIINVGFPNSGVYLFACKVHPYMAGVVVVLNQDSSIPDVTGADLGFINRALNPDGLLDPADVSLPAVTVASVLTVIAPLDSGTFLGIELGKDNKWDLTGVTTDLDFDGDGTDAKGVGEIWIDTQFEAVDDQEDTGGLAKPGTITVLDASTFGFVQEIDGVDGGGPDPGILVGGDNGWNNPHNMWADVTLDSIYNGNWFGQWLNLIQRDNGDIQDTINVGFAPTHIVTIPDETSAQFGILTLPLSAEEDIVKVEDLGGSLNLGVKIPTGAGNNHPHGQWITSDGSKILIPNVFQGLGLGGSVTIMDAETGNIIREILSTDADGANLLLPVAAGIKGNDKGYIANIGTGTVSVLDFATNMIINDIKVACFNSVLSTPATGDGTGTCAGATDQTGIVLDTLKLPIQTPPSPDGKWVATAVFSLVSDVNPDTIAIIDTRADGGKGELVAELPCPAGCHGSNWGAKDGGGYYAYITSQHSNILTVVDPDPNNDDDGSDAEIAAQIVLANGGPTGGLTDGSGGQGILPLPIVSNGWVQDTVAACDDGQCSDEVEGWINDLTAAQKDPSFFDQVVGGLGIPLESTSLILAGAQSFSWMIPLVLSVIGIGLFVVSRKSE